ncbi:MAG: IscS subfamily cysteine desulfurase [Candidatus Krumholzibacteriia bacterium]
MELPIYMDCHATTPVDPRVLDAMLPYLREHFGNASSRTHSFGWVAEEAVEKARAQVAMLLGAVPREIVFTSGATEAIHLGLRGAAWGRKERGRHLVTTNIEHKAVLATLKHLSGEGFQVTHVPVGSDGVVDPEAVEAALRPQTILVSVMAANNEIGTLQPLREIGARTHARGILFFVDAAQAVGKVPLDVETMHIDLLSLSAHKLYGPKGVGALYVRRRGGRVRLLPQVGGGGQERGLRSGTLNVPGIVGLGEACEVAGREMAAEAERVLALRERLRSGIDACLPDVTVNGSLEHRLPGNLNMSFAGAQGESLLMQLNDIAVSPGAACDSRTTEPSHVMRALGVSDDLARSSVRFGLGRFNTDEEVDYVIEKVVRVVQRLRGMSPLYASETPVEEGDG